MHFTHRQACEKCIKKASNMFYIRCFIIVCSQNRKSKKSVSELFFLAVEGGKLLK